MIVKCPRCGNLADVPNTARMCTECGGNYNSIRLPLWMANQQYIEYGRNRTARLPRYEHGKDGKLRKAKHRRVCHKWRQRNK